MKLSPFQRARAALKDNLPTALLVVLCANLPSMLAQVMQVSLGDPFGQIMTQLQLNARQSAGMTTQELLASLQPLFTTSLYVVAGVTLLARLVFPFLSLGANFHMLKLVRGQEGSLRDVVSRAGLFFKAIGLLLYEGLLMLLWMLPGMVPMLLALLMVPADATQVVGLARFLINISPFTMIVSMVLMLRAAIRYSLSDLVMTDNPSTGIRAAVRQSVQLVSGRIGRLLSVYFVYFLVLIAVSYFSSMLAGISTVIWLTVRMALNLVLSVYFSTTVAALYEELRGK